MKKNKIVTLLFVLLAVIGCGQVTAASINITGKRTMESYKDTELYIKDKSELHLTSATPLQNSHVYLETIDSWFYLTNLRPSQVVNDWLQYVYVGSEPAVLNGNVRVEIYRHGTVIIPHAKTFKPLEVFTEKDFQGNSASYEINTYHNNLGDMSTAIRSFKLKKGYMATFAVKPDGTGFSRVFIADKEDLIVPELQVELDQSVSFIRVFRWRWVSQKGWAGGGDRVDKIQATWFYGWNADYQSTLDAEYSPMRHFRHWPGWDQINAHQYSTAVLGFNEPENKDDHKNENPPTMSVDECISLWPNLLKSGLRVGSPAPTDGRTDYLYEFIDKCDALNYRVDFVAVHFYRGGQTPTQLYNWLKAIHERTKRPIWITEWNNGANWTSEWWPSDASEQQAKQQKDMTAFFNMLDTVSFVERHAVYNAVEWKRYMIDDNGNLTPAGQMMRDFKSKLAYNPAKEFKPLPWKYRVPKISATVVNNNRDLVRLSLADNENGVLVTNCLVELKKGEDEYLPLDTIAVSSNTLVLQYDLNPKEHGSYYFRVRYQTKDEGYTAYSNDAGFVLSPSNEIQMGKISVLNENWTVSYFGQKFKKTPVALLGTHTLNNPVLLTWRGLATNNSQMSFRAYPWEYISTYKITKPEYIPYLFLEEGTHDWSGIKALAGKTSADEVWKQVSFSSSFEEVPAVFAFQTSNNTSIATAVRIRNVTREGFEISVKKETAQTETVAEENISYLAVAYGEGSLDGRKVIVGKTANKEIGTSRNAAALAEWQKDLQEPLFFSFMQTANDDLGAVLRLSETTDRSASFFKQAERSPGATTVAKETGAWMVIEGKDDDNSSISGVKSHIEKPVFYPNPTSDYLYFSEFNNGSVIVEVYSSLGQVLKRAPVVGGQLDVQDLPQGQYIIKINGVATKFIKQ